jgi:branched-chain amino acid transport system ATP-binding protein
LKKVLILKDISKYFGHTGVIQEVNLEVIKGERHALIGPNGAGKSTLFNLITGHYKPSGGDIYFKDKRINGLAPHEITRLGIARSFQIINIFKDMTVYENMRITVTAKHRMSLNFGCRITSLQQIREESENVLSRVGLLQFMNEPAGTLGYSQQRALEVGLAVALDPELLLLDEPGAGLSPDETKAVVALIREVTMGKTLVIVEHDMDVVFDLADKISVLNYGTIVASGTPDQIRRNETVKEIYLGNVLQEKNTTRVSDDVTAG